MTNFTNRKLTILYGSQTGNAQDVSERLWREAKRYYFTGPILSLDEYDIGELIQEKCCIFICSTTGQGEEPDNMKKFWKFLLRKNLPQDSLINLQYSVLGLGDSSYVKYNFVAKRLHKRLAQLGAKTILPLTLADDQHDLGYDSVVDEWIPSVLKMLLDIYPVPSNIKINFSDIFIEPRWNINTFTSKKVLNNTYIYFNNHYKNPDDSFLVKIIANDRITSETHFQDVRLIKFATNGQIYKPGDILYVRPQNSNENINKFYEILHANNVDINRNISVILKAKDSYMPVPTYLKNELTLERLLFEYFDLCSIPRRNVFALLAQITTNDLEKEKLIEFTTPEGQEDLYNYCNRPRRNILEVLQDFPYACSNLTIDMMFEIFSPIKPRAFSIASSYQAHKNELHILVAVVKYKTKLINERIGLCSNWLANLNIGTELPIWIKSGSFKFPTCESTPIIMVGPGTGVAPFRSYLCEEEVKNKLNAKNQMLIFGCRNKEHDFLCKDDFKRLENNGKLTLFCAFSRDQDFKIYVQNKIEENGSEVWNRLKDQSSSIFVAGNSKNMPQSVRESFINVCKMHGKMDADQAKLFIDMFDKQGRYQTETWA